MEVNQRKILRVLQLISHLKQRPSKSIKYLSGLLETTDRTVYRYFDLLSEIGFELKRDNFNRYYLDDGGHPLDLLFKPEELEYIRTVLIALPVDDPTRDSILAKIPTPGQDPEV